MGRVGKEVIIKVLSDNGIVINDHSIDKLEIYADFLSEYNEKVNLTAITEPGEVAVKHFADSLKVLTLADIPEGARMIDVGSGAGFPSVPIKAVRDDIKLTALDSLNKRIVFLGELSQRTGCEFSAVHARAEEAGRLPAMREKFDIATARAVANLAELAEYCLPFVKPGGVFLAMKGPEPEDELKAAGKAIAALGGKVGEVKKYSLSDGSGRSLIIIEKISQTPPKYPRPSAKIAKSPIK